jgi:hypothetical protein
MVKRYSYVFLQINYSAPTEPIFIPNFSFNEPSQLVFKEQRLFLDGSLSSRNEKGPVPQLFAFSFTPYPGFGYKDLFVGGYC